MPNSGPGGPPGTRVMTIFVFYVSAQIPKIEYFVVYGSLQAPGGISSFSREISRRMPLESCLGTPWGPSYEHIYKNIYFWKGRLQ